MIYTNTNTREKYMNAESEIVPVLTPSSDTVELTCSEGSTLYLAKSTTGSPCFSTPIWTVCHQTLGTSRSYPRIESHKTKGSEQ